MGNSMADVQELISKIDHGFTKYNPFYDHNYRITINKLENEFTRMSALENKDFTRLFRRYSNLVKAPVDFIMHIVKNALCYEKPRSSVASVRRSLGTEYTVAWCYDPTTEICILYTSVYHDSSDWDSPVKLNHGLLIQWKNWKLGKVERVEIGTGKRTNLLEADSLFTTSSMRYSIQRVSPKISDHLERGMFGNKVRLLMLDQVCNKENWEPAVRFLKHHTRDYKGVDSMFMDALLKERELALKYIKAEDVTNVSKALLATMDTIIKGAGSKFMSETEFLSCNKIEYAIIYGANASLYYTLWSDAHECYYFLEVNDTRNMVGLYRGAIGTTLEQMERIKITDVLGLINKVDESSNG